MATKKVTKSEALAAEATVRKPANAPEFLPMIALSRRQRAEFVRALAAIEKRSAALEAAASQESPDLDSGAVILEVLADIEDLLRVVAVDKDAYDRWVSECDDEDLSAALTWYMERNPLGEPKASPA